MAYLLSLGLATPVPLKFSKFDPNAKLRFLMGVLRLARRDKELNQDADLVNRFPLCGEFSLNWVVSSF